MIIGRAVMVTTGVLGSMALMGVLGRLIGFD